jgi:hypothetical protein
MDRHNNGNRIFLRNAGANVLGLIRSIESIEKKDKVGKITVYVHDDCKAMSLVYNIVKNGKIEDGKVILDGKPVDDEVIRTLVDQFKDEKFDTISELEQLNKKKQEEALKKLSERIDCSVEMILVKNLNVPSNSAGHNVFVMKPSEMPYKKLMGDDMFGHYVIQGEYIDELKPDISVARILNLRDYSIISLKNEDARESKKIMDILRIKIGKDENTSVNLVKI